MPNFDGRGPGGFRAGRGLGPCGQGIGRGARLNRRWGGNFSNQVYNSDQKEFLKQEIKLLDEEKKQLEDQLKNLSQD
jgi:hypothetical protein